MNLTKTDTVYKYEFEEHPLPKGTCPSCGHTKEFRYYKGLSREYGKCERTNNCDYWNKPTGEIEIKPTPKTPEKKIIYPEPDYCLGLVNNRMSNFHRFCEGLGIPENHLIKWGVGTKPNDTETVFIYSDKNGKALNIKSFSYNKNGKRDKAKKPYYLPVGTENRYSRRFYGEHLLSGKTICLVEAEKTAEIASFFYPQYDWLSTGGNNGLKDTFIDTLFKQRVLYIKDADKAGSVNSTIDKLKAYKINFSIIDLFPGRTDSYDLADAIAEGLRPVIDESIAQVLSESKILETEIVKPDPLGFSMNFFYKKKFTKPAFTINGNKLINPGEIFTLLAHPGGGKSQICETIAALFIANRAGIKIDSLGFNENVAEDSKLLYIDMERPYDQVREGMDKIARRLNVTEDSELIDKKTGEFTNVILKCWIDYPGFAERRKGIEELVSVNKIGLFLLDGILGISSLNDEDKAHEVVIWLMSLANKYGFALIVTMHPNKNSEIMAGHIGSFLYRYSRACLFLKNHPNNKEVKMVTDDFPQGKTSYIQPGNEVYFSYNKEENLFMSEGSAPPPQPKKSITNSKNFELIFNEFLIKGQSSIAVGEIKKRYQEITGLGKDAAKKHLEGAVEMGILIPAGGQGKATTYKIRQNE